MRHVNKGSIEYQGMQKTGRGLVSPGMPATVVVGAIACLSCVRLPHGNFCLGSRPQLIYPSDLLCTPSLAKWSVIGWQGGFDRNTFHFPIWAGRHRLTPPAEERFRFPRAAATVFEGHFSLKITAPGNQSVSSQPIEWSSSPTRTKCSSPISSLNSQASGLATKR